MLISQKNITFAREITKTVRMERVKTDDNNITTYETREFTSINSSILSLKQWLLDNNCKDLCMESTGKYWIPVFNLLEDSINVFLVHPKYVKAITGKKTDTKDSVWIADIFKHDISFFLTILVMTLSEYVMYGP